MDIYQLQKMHAINKSKKHQLLDNFLLYSMTVLTCSIFCSSPFWFPTLFSSIKLFLSVSLPKLASLILNSKFIFIVGNLIIFLLIGESKFFASNPIPTATDLYYNEYVNCKKGLQNSPTSTLEEKKEGVSFKENASKACEGMKSEARAWDERKMQVVEKESGDLDGEEENNFPTTEELNRRADDFIARVNRQRMQEAKLLLY